MDCHYACRSAEHFSRRTFLHGAAGALGAMSFGGMVHVRAAEQLMAQQKHCVVFWLAGGVLLSAALYAAFPLGYEPSGRRLHGLARFEHLHHALDVVALLIPALVLLAAELRTPQRSA